MCHRQVLKIGNLARYCTQTTNEVSKVKVDYIGPPDPVSNLRPIKFYQSKNESDLEKKYRETREATQIWNQNFWSKHNESFIKERTQYRDNLKSQGKENVTADEMSVFYKEFLDRNWKTHVSYNFNWYQKNIYLLFLEFKVRLLKFKIK